MSRGFLEAVLQLLWTLLCNAAMASAVIFEAAS